MASNGGTSTLLAEVVSTAEPEVVFSVLTDWSRHHEWMPFTTAQGGQGVGALLEGRTGIGPFAFLDAMVITEWIPGRKVAVRHTGRVVKGVAWFATDPVEAGGTRVEWVEDLTPPFGALGRVGWSVLRPALLPAMTGFMTFGLRRLAALAEAEVHSARP